MTAKDGGGEMHSRYLQTEQSLQPTFNADNDAFTFDAPNRCYGKHPEAKIPQVKIPAKWKFGKEA